MKHTDEPSLRILDDEGRTLHIVSGHLASLRDHARTLLRYYSNSDRAVRRGSYIGATDEVVMTREEAVSSR